MATIFGTCDLTSKH